MERVRRALRDRTGRDPNAAVRAATTFGVLTISIVAAQGIGLVNLIAKGYRFISWVLIVIFILPIIYTSIVAPKLEPT
jgi:uncharacterized membrane protein YkvI